MAQRILKFGGLDMMSRMERETGDEEPEQDPRRSEATIVSGLHLMSAVEQLEPCADTDMYYAAPDSPLLDMSLEEAQEAVRAGEVDLTAELTKTGRFAPLVNPRRNRRKRAGELPADGDSDLWHVPTSNYNPMPPRRLFSPMAQAIDAHDDIPNDAVFGEFRERRNGGEVFGEILFDTMRVNVAGSDPVRLGLRFGWNYFGSKAFSIQPFAQRTRCSNSVAALGERVTVMHHNRSTDLREMYEEAIAQMDLVSRRLSIAIEEALEVVLEFDADPDEEPADGVHPVPMSVEEFYLRAGLDADTRTMAEAAEEAAGAGGRRRPHGRLTAWDLHNGATYWLSWHWSGSESSRRFRGLRRAADDLLFNPLQMFQRAVREYENDIERRIAEDVLGEGGSLEDASEEERRLIEERLADHSGLTMTDRSEASLADLVRQFEDTEERLDRMAEQMEAQG